MKETDRDDLKRRAPGAALGLATTRFGNLPHHQRALALDMIVAWRVLLLVRMGKEHPNLSADLFYTPEELGILGLKKKNCPATAPRAKGN